MKRLNYFSLLFFILISQLAGLIGAVATTPAIRNWYVYLNKPFFTPPNWIFAPVWTLLFLLMGISASLVYQKGLFRKEVKKALYFFIIQLTLNILWSYLFFGYKLLFVAFIEIVVLWFFIFLTLKSFYKVEKISGLLMIPYLLWVSFASFLNLAVFLLN